MDNPLFEELEMDKGKTTESTAQDLQKPKEGPEKVKTPYVAPKFESHNPLEIMSAFEDKSSELPF